MYCHSPNDINIAITHICKIKQLTVFHISTFFLKIGHHDLEDSHIMQISSSLLFLTNIKIASRTILIIECNKITSVGIEALKNSKNLTSLTLGTVIFTFSDGYEISV